MSSPSPAVLCLVPHPAGASPSRAICARVLEAAVRGAPPDAVALVRSTSLLLNSPPSTSIVLGRHLLVLVLRCTPANLGPRATNKTREIAREAGGGLKHKKTERERAIW